MNKTNSQKTVEKIQKMLALSQSSSEAEALEAFKKAQDLMLRHNLSLTDLERASTQKPAKYVLYRSGKLRVWKNILAVAIAESNHCLCYLQRGTSISVFGVIGRRVNADAARIQFEYLVNTIENLAKEAQGDRRYKSSLKLGITATLHRRIAELIEQQKEEGICADENSPNSSALVVRSLYETLLQENLRFTEEMPKVKQKPKKPVVTSPEGFLHGIELGEDVSLGQQQDNSTTSPLS
ncbi:DUF2786 domain-containing protein (plasmid) [Nostoc sp. C052]|uniref:DUF2786 domain-containing protein n=1 Tax=Nostoc sp. C052 TaxID=2576902 RepID=UPI0015C31567|nr:DUF2786 domain-containing protein [Nostoc sp. C052]QLE46488.1 DUF2786 domain-containing protein [Nostoc sp. C052]